MKSLLILSIALLPVAVFADSTYKNPIAIDGVKTIPDLLLAFVDLVFLVGMPIVVIFIIYAGMLFVTGGDNEAKVGKARSVLLWTLVGAGVLMGAKALGMAIQATVLTLK